ncbi:LLM class flavin-dependent oxidoreductase [Nonomuraea rhizosphaerae]|uniref:LLM class flavin-dependent oxidoreductase n=1 Tax=Nonomuraea rhizosphaerae TaxID=2665663 RepID=UPI001C5D8F44|nr:LLM class flavin-dependent oxidoreductase [Nonomuraea rhizosphaerae]
MRKGIVVTAHVGVEELAARAEALGFSSFWVYDTPMLHGDPFAALSLCAKATSRIKLGVGVTSPALRSAPAAANHFAGLNALAPGRVICGIGTGNTARRTLGMLPTTMAELESFTASLQALCSGGSAAYREGDRTREVEFLHVGPYVNTTDPIEFVVAAFGMKAAAVAGRRGSGLLSFGLLDPGVWTALTEEREKSATAAGQRAEADSYVMTSMHVLAHGEDPYGDAARDAMGHIALSLLTFAADNPSTAANLPEEQKAAVERLLSRRGTTATSTDRHKVLYRNYLGRIAPEDRDLVLPSLIDTIGLVGGPDELAARIGRLERAGVDELVIQPVIDPDAEMAAFAGLAI